MPADAGKENRVEVEEKPPQKALKEVGTSWGRRQAIAECSPKGNQFAQYIE